MLPDGGMIPSDVLQGRARMDEWVNILTGIGTSRDKRTSATFRCDPVTDAEARELWRGDDMVKRIIELPPKEEVRQGYGIATPDKLEMQDVIDTIDTLHINRVFARAKQFERAYGGAGVMPLVNDAMGSFTKPLNRNAVTSIRGWEVFEPRELHPQQWYTEPGHPKYGKPMTYRVVAINGGGGGIAMMTEIHESRLIIFPGVRVSREQPAGAPYGWGDNVLTPIKRVLADFHLTWGSVAALLQDFSQGVFKLDKLADILMDPEGEAVAQKRILTMEMMRSILRGIVLDKNDDFKRDTVSLAGVPDVLERFCLRLAAAVGWPLTVLMGTSPAGMNATGESDIRSFYATIASEQEQDRPLLEDMIRFAFLAKDGVTRGKEPSRWKVAFHSLWAPSAKETAETLSMIADADDKNIQNQVYSPEEAAKRYKGDGFDLNVKIDWDARARLQLAGPPVVLPDPPEPEPEPDEDDPPVDGEEDKESEEGGDEDKTAGKGDVRALSRADFVRQHGEAVLAALVRAAVGYLEWYEDGEVETSVATLGAYRSVLGDLMDRRVDAALYRGLAVDEGADLDAAAGAAVRYDARGIGESWSAREDIARAVATQPSLRDPAQPSVGVVLKLSAGDVSMEDVLLAPPSKTARWFEVEVRRKLSPGARGDRAQRREYLVVSRSRPVTVADRAPIIRRRAAG